MSESTIKTADHLSAKQIIMEPSDGASAKYIVEDLREISGSGDYLDARPPNRASANGQQPASGSNSPGFSQMEDTNVLDTSQLIPRCGKCGSDTLLVPDGVIRQEDLTDSSLITCGSCHGVSTFFEILKACETSDARDLMMSTIRRDVGNVITHLPH
jgi:hypothetical protein